jgi:hypothetical protein
MSQYEFSNEQNTLIGSLASKMRVVGLFFVVLGVLNVLVALLVVLAIYRDRIPKGWVDRLPAEVKTQALPAELDKLPPSNHLWGIAINAGLIGLFYILMGGWTRAAGVSFQQIVTTTGRDISHLMNALSSLEKMYALVYTLLIITLLVGLIALGLSLWASFTS